MPETYAHLGSFSDWVSFASRQQTLYPPVQSGEFVRNQLRQILGFCHLPESPLAVKVEDRWEWDGIQGEAVSWWVGYGPRTHAYLLRPKGVKGPLPGVVALHDHGGFKYYGKEKIADGPLDLSDVLAVHREAYGGRAFANELAKEGFAVLVHDTFLWGSRRFPLDEMPVGIQRLARLEMASAGDVDGPFAEILEYNLAAAHHEHLIEKYCNLLGTTMAGVVCYEDRVAANYLLSRADVITSQVACIGLSGGGNRAALLLATHGGIQAAVIVGLMSTYSGLLDHNVYSHTWMLFPSGWSRYGDWQDIAACRAPMPLLVQYDLDDELFTVEGMKAAHERIADHYQKAGSPQNYLGLFYPGPHKFDLEMQTTAFNWLKEIFHRSS